jgi:hypothetical protein
VPLIESHNLIIVKVVLFYVFLLTYDIYTQQLITHMSSAIDGNISLDMVGPRIGTEKEATRHKSCWDEFTSPP